MSEEGLRLYSELVTASDRPRLIASAVSSHRIPPDELPELIWFVWVKTDEPTRTLGEAAWMSIFKTAGFFSWPATRERPLAPMTIYRDATADRLRHMYWAENLEVARTLGRRHVSHAPAAVYSATIPPEAVLAFLERRGEGTTVVVDSTQLTYITLVEHLNQPWPRP